MNKPSFETMRAAMVDCQLRTVGVTDSRVVDAISAIPRERFVPKSRELLAYLDEDQPIADGRCISEPMVFGRLLNAARIGADERVLLIGAGTGYGAAVIARLAAEVVAVEENAELAAQARGILSALGVANASIVEGALNAGCADGAPYDVIFVDGAVEQIPQALIDQLRDGGRLIGVLIDETGIGRGVIGVRSGQGFGTTAFTEAATAKLPGFDRPKGFSF